MGTPILGEIRIMSFNFAPKGWVQCNGQFLPINQNQALFSLLGTMYGGNGSTTFALPNLQARVPIHRGNGYTVGQAGGVSAVLLTQSQMPQHVHLMQAATVTPPANAANATPGTNGTRYLAPGIASLQGGQTAPVNMYGAPSNLVAMSASATTNYGGSQAHENMMPYLSLMFCIALQGAFPSRN